MVYASYFYPTLNSYVLHIWYELILPESSTIFPKSCDLWPCDLISLFLTLVLKIENGKENQKNNKKNKKENKKKLSPLLLVLAISVFVAWNWDENCVV